MSDKQWFLDAFDEFVESEGDGGAAREKSRDGVARRYEQAVENGEINRPREPLIDEGRALFDRHIGAEITRRRTSLRKSMDHLLDVLAGETVLGAGDPALHQAYPLGDGSDKTLGLWTPDDWQAATFERYRNAAEATRAASNFDERAQRFLVAMRQRGVRTTGDLFA